MEIRLQLALVLEVNSLDVADQPEKKMLRYFTVHTIIRIMASKTFNIRYTFHGIVLRCAFKQSQVILAFSAYFCDRPFRVRQVSDITPRNVRCFDVVF